MQKKIGVLFALWFAFCAAVSVGILGFGVWAIYTIVTWIASQ